MNMENEPPLLAHSEARLCESCPHHDRSPFMMPRRKWEDMQHNKFSVKPFPGNIIDHKRRANRNYLVRISELCHDSRHCVSGVTPMKL